MGPAPPPQPPQGVFFGAHSWPWGIGEQGQSSPSASWTDAMVEGGDGGGAGLRFLLQFDPGRPGFDRTLLGVSLSALLSRLLGWSKDGGGQGRVSIAIAGEEGGGGGGIGSGNATVSAAAVAAAVSLCLAAMYASDQRPRRAPSLPRQRRRLPAPDSAARLRALPAPDDGLRILSSNDESLENVIHGASVGAGDDEPDIVARVQMDTTPAEIVGANADDEPEQDPSEQEERQELERLRELWLSLLEREQRLELRLQELEGLRAQVSTLRELEGRVAAAAVEERLLQLKVSTLQDENGRLRAQVEELDTARAELARAKEKLRAIKARVQAEQEEARREAAVLRAKVADLETGGEETAGALAAEIEELRKANTALEEANLELALRLQDAQQAASSSVDPVLDQEDMADEEARYLRESNERLTRQMEQLHNDHCAHVEELVYLKWVNACLRHELRDHDGHPTTEQQDHHHDGNAGAGDLQSALELSKSMSFRSSERAKQLMLRYGHPGLEGFDPALFSPLHESVHGDGDERRSPARNYYEPERSPYARSEKTMAASAAAGGAAAAPGKKTGPRKLKFLGNIKKLLPGGKRGHSSHGHGHAGRDNIRKAPAPSDEYLEKAMQWLSAHDAFDGVDHSYESTPLSSCARTPLSSVTTATTADSRARGGGGETTTRAEAGQTMTRSKSDAGRSYGREASQYHALRPDHPAGGGVEPDGFRAPEKREPRRRSEELRSPARGGVMRTGGMH